MRNILLLLLLAPLYASCQKYIFLQGQVVRPVVIDTSQDIIVMYGQSNMIGRPTAEAQDLITNPDVLQLSRGRHNGLNNEIIAAINPLEFQDSDAGDMGMGLEIGKTVQEATGGIITIQPEGVGATPISLFIPGQANWTNLVARSNFIESSAPDREVTAFVWHQGESDANPSTLVDAYLGQLTLIRDEITTEFGNIPMLIGGLMPTFRTNGGFTEPMQLKLIECANTIANVHYIPSYGLYGSIDNLHFSQEPLRRFGKRYGMKINSLVYGIEDIAEKPVFNIYFESPATASINIDYIYSTSTITAIEVYAGGALVGSLNSPTQDYNGPPSISVGNVSGLDVYVRVQNSEGWSDSDIINRTYSTIPTADHQWLMDETTGTVVSDNIGVLDGVLSVDASTVTTTLNGNAAFNFTGAEEIIIPELTMSSKFTVCWEADPVSASRAIVGKPNTSYVFVRKPRFSTVSDPTNMVISVDDSARHKMCYVVDGPRIRLYIDGALAAEEAHSYPSEPFQITELGCGWDGLCFIGQFRDIRIWDNVILDPDHISQL